jgi:hypothetical protein
MAEPQGIRGLCQIIEFDEQNTEYQLVKPQNAEIR